MAEIAPLRPAATVIVLRPSASHPFEVLLVRRSDKVAFMAGAHVFPGGRVDPTDDAAPAEACDGAATLGRCPDLTADEEARYRVAAIRELVEEAGVLLARRDGAMADSATAAAVRASLRPDVPFVAQLAAQGLTVALDAVMPFAHWVTPEIEIRRFDTRFLLARVPADQDASHDDGEMTDLEWMTPAAAIARATRGAIKLPPPTWNTLAQLGNCASIDHAWAWAASTPMPRIQPGFHRHGDATIFTLPGDPSFAGPAHGAAFAHSRFELVDGTWRPVRS
jgi:8-oxo-dGTP pyrophosphatase MutT (NUDIX family)